MRCARVCPQHAVEVGGGFVFIDWDRCDGCAKCVAECEPGALQLRRTQLHAVEDDARIAPAPVPPAALTPAPGKSRAPSC
jgi:Fe-S-cluster-containing hydrogenase component 2